MSEEPVQAEIVPYGRNPHVPDLIESVEGLIAKRKTLEKYASQALVPDHDYGVIPGTSRKNLLKPGAEKLLHIYGLFPRFTCTDKVEVWGGPEMVAYGGRPFFRYIYRCDVVWARNMGDGTLVDVVVANCDGEANSRESKYDFRWEPEFKLTPEQVEQATTQGWEREERVAKTSGKKFWWVKMPNADPFTLVNTLMKMAQKRAMVGATLIAVKASDLFTQDLEDMAPDTVKPDTAPKASAAPTPSASINLLVEEFSALLKEKAYTQAEVQALAMDVTHRECKTTRDFSPDELKSMVEAMRQGKGKKSAVAQAPAPAPTPKPEPEVNPNDVPATLGQVEPIMEFEKVMGKAAFDEASADFLGRKFDPSDVSEAEAKGLLEYLSANPDTKAAKRPDVDGKGVKIEASEWGKCGSAKKEGCGKEILWRKNPNTGRPQPLDPETGESHLKTCPKGTTFRKPTTPGAGPDDTKCATCDRIVDKASADIQKRIKKAPRCFTCIQKDQPAEVGF